MKNGKSVAAANLGPGRKFHRLSDGDELFDAQTYHQAV